MLVEAFGPEIFETYGSREVMLMASECDAHDGMHLSMENLVVEVLVLILSLLVAVLRSSRGSVLFPFRLLGAVYAPSHHREAK